MKLHLTVLILSALFLTAGCGKKDNTDTSKTKDEKTNVQSSANDKSLEVHVSGMTCTGCENTIKSQVKKVDGVKEVNADHKTNVVKASYDPAKTNPDAIKDAIIASGYKVEHTH